MSDTLEQIRSTPCSPALARVRKAIAARKGAGGQQAGLPKLVHDLYEVEHVLDRYAERESTLLKIVEKLENGVPDKVSDVDLNAAMGAVRCFDDSPDGCYEWWPKPAVEEFLRAIQWYQSKCAKLTEKLSEAHDIINRAAR